MPKIFILLGYFAILPETGLTQDRNMYSDNPMRTPLDSMVDTRVKKYFSIPDTKGMSIVLLDSAHTHYYHYGTTGNPKQPAPDSTTLYEIGSITKTFTATLLAGLLLKNEISLNDPINMHLPDSVADLSFEGEPIRIIHLSNHSSGFPEAPADLIFGGYDPQKPFDHYSRERLLNYLTKFKPFVKPGTGYRYSNLAVSILGFILERKTGKVFEELVLEEIARPLNMNATYISPTDVPEEKMAIGHNEKGEETPYWALNAFQAAGAIRSCATDMAKYARAQWREEDDLLFRAIQRTHQKTSETEGPVFGLGWMIDPVKNGDEVVHHNGRTFGFGSFLYVNKTKKKALIFMANGTAGATEGAWLRTLLINYMWPEKQ